MKDQFAKILLIATTLVVSTSALAGAVAPPAPVEAPVMAPWALGIMAALIAAIAYRVKKK